MNPWIAAALGWMVGFWAGILLVLRLWTLDTRRLRAERAEAKKRGWKQYEGDR